MASDPEKGPYQKSQNPETKPGSTPLRPAPDPRKIGGKALDGAGVKKPGK